MYLLIKFITDYLYIYLWLLFTTFVNVIAPLPGSVIVNPVTAFFTDPQRAIGIGAYIFVCTGLHRTFLFRKEILKEERNIRIIKIMLPYSMLGALLGGTLILYLNIKALVVLIIFTSLYFIIETIRRFNTTTKKNDIEIKGNILVSVLSGFLQGAGMPGSDIRNNYLRTVISEVSVRAVGSVIGVVNFFVAGTVILFHNQLTQTDLIFIATIVPLLIPVQIYGKRYLDRLGDKHAKILGISLSLLGILLLTYKYFP